jgi:hypothetical protein
LEKPVSFEETVKPGLEDQEKRGRGGGDEGTCNMGGGVMNGEE